jgi:hypothetical protein
MAFSIEEIKGEVNKQNGLMKPSLFAVEVNFVSKSGLFSSKSIGLLCNAVNLPGVSLATSDVQRQGYGFLERRVTNAIFPAVAATFMLDNKGEVLGFFNEWSKTMSSFAHQQGELSTDPDTGGMMGEVGYYDDYTATINITAYSPNEDKIVVYTLNEAYPAVVGDVALGWRQTDEFAELQIQFNYRYWNSSVFKPAEREPEEGGLNLLQFINKLNGAVEIVKSLKKPRSIGDAMNLLNNGETLLGIFK